MKIHKLIGVALVAAAVTIALAASHDAAAALISSAGQPVDLALRELVGVALAHGLVVPGARGLIRVRADATDPAKLIEQLNKAWSDFREEHKKEQADIKAKLGDVVQSEKVDRINTEITKLQTAIDDLNKKAAALAVGGTGKEVDPNKAAHATAFNQFFRRGVDSGLKDLEVKAALRTDSDADGGFIVPETVEQQIDRVLGTVSAMRSIARVMSISTGEYKKAVSQGGAGGGWVGENETRSETNTPTLAELSFPAHEVYAEPAASQVILDDARVDVGAWLGEEVSITFAELEGAAHVSGDGVKKPRGILSYDTVADASYAWGKLGFIASGVAADIFDATHNGVDQLIALVYALKQGYRQNARFIMNRKLQAAVRKLKTIGDTEAYLWQPSVQAGQPSTLLGYPLVDDDNMPDVGANAFPIAFGDFNRGYIIVDRMGIRVLRDPFTKKGYVKFYTTKRTGGGVQNFEAIKLLKCST